MKWGVKEIMITIRLNINNLSSVSESFFLFSQFPKIPLFPCHFYQY